MIDEVFPAVCAILVAFSGTGQVLAAENVDNSWNFTINGQQIDASNSGSVRIQNVTAPDQFGPNGPGTARDLVSDDFVRAIGVSSQGGVNRYAFSEFFQIRQGQTYTITNLTFTDVPPHKPESLTIICTNRILRVGEPRQLEVLARFADGTTTNVAPRTSWTSYRVSNPNLASVSPDGLVTPLRPGVIYVTAVNEGASAVCGLNVVVGMDGLTALVGTVVDTNGSPVARATIYIYDLESNEIHTGPDGRFSVAEVPTTLGPLKISVRAAIDGTFLLGFLRVNGISGGSTLLGRIVVAPSARPSQQCIAAGDDHTVALREDGTLWAWGSNRNGQLGNEALPWATTLPQPISPAVTWQGVAAGYYHTMALRDDGTLWAWGWNSDGQLGTGSFTTNYPFGIYAPQSIPANVTWRAVAAGFGHTVALRTDGTLWAWGSRFSGTLVRTNAPQPLLPDFRWLAASAGFDHTMALREDGMLWAWGNNENGQLGSGTLGFANTPQSILLDTTWRAVAAGRGYTVALRADGTLWAWGNNESGQLGNGTFTSTNTPQAVLPNATWRTVAAGFRHTVALRTDGTLWAWGRNSVGQLGNGTFIDTNKPQAILSNSTWSAVAAGFNHTVALRNDGTLWTWGDNEYGQLGNGTQRTASTPQQISGGAVWGPPAQPQPP